MLKTYRIIPLVFILFFFGFTLITVAPVLAQSTQENESRINALEELLCSLHPEAGTEKHSVCDVKKQRGRVETDSVRQMDRAEAEREAARGRLAEIEAERERQAVIAEVERVRQIEAERARLAEMEAARARLAEMEAERVRQAGIEALRVRRAEMEAERAGQVEAALEEYGETLTEKERAYIEKRSCAQFPEARSYQECMQKTKLQRTCRQNPTLAECSR